MPMKACGHFPLAILPSGGRGWAAGSQGWGVGVVPCLRVFGDCAGPPTELTSLGPVGGMGGEPVMAGGSARGQGSVRVGGEQLANAGVPFRSRTCR